MIQVSKPSAASRTRNDTGFNSFSPVVGGFELLEIHTVFQQLKQIMVNLAFNLLEPNSGLLSIKNTRG